jgi:hypothetical protein
VTPVGILRERDCIYLDSVDFSDGVSTLILRGELNRSLCSAEADAEAPFLSYTIRFDGVLAVRMVELDSWDWTAESSFDEVIESPWLSQLGGKITRDHRHFVVQTYDDVFDVACRACSVVVHVGGAGAGSEGSPPDDSWPRSPEHEYLADLAHERHMFAWCFVEYGGRTHEEAEQAALDAYPYEPPEEEYRGLKFHDLAWHWAMLTIFRDGYWRTHPELASATERYHAESRRFDMK